MIQIVYITAIAWLYVVFMMAIVSKSFIGGLMTFALYGILPCALFLWLVGTPQRKRTRLREITEQELGQPDTSDTKSN